MSNKLQKTVDTLKYLLGYNVEEIAKSINYSRVHLTKQMKKETDDDTTESLNTLLIEKHKEALQNATFEVQEDQANYIVAPKANVGKEIGFLRERNIILTASLNVLEQMVDKLVSDQTGTSIALVSGQRKQATEMEAKRLFGEEYKLHKQV